MSGFLRFTARILFIAAALAGGLFGSAFILYRWFFFVHEADVATHVEPIYG